MIKSDTYCANCHWQYHMHYGPERECPAPDGAQAFNPEGCFELPIHGESSMAAVEAVDAPYEPLFDMDRIWRVQKIGLSILVLLGLLVGLLTGLYIGHFVW